MQSEHMVPLKSNKGRPILLELDNQRDFDVTCEYLSVLNVMGQLNDNGEYATIDTD